MGCRRSCLRGREAVSLCKEALRCLMRGRLASAPLGASTPPFHLSWNGSPPGSMPYGVTVRAFTSISNREVASAGMP